MWLNDLRLILDCTWLLSNFKRVKLEEERAVYSTSSLCLHSLCFRWAGSILARATLHVLIRNKGAWQYTQAVRAEILPLFLTQRMSFWTGHWIQHNWFDLPAEKATFKLSDLKRLLSPVLIVTHDQSILFSLCVLNSNTCNLDWAIT